MNFRKNATIIACYLLYFTGINALLRVFNQRRGRIPILMYHSIQDAGADGGENSCLSLLGMVVQEDIFKRQLKYLKKHYGVISLKELLGYLQKRQKPPRGAAVITFDDGFLDNYTVAVPILQKKRFPATFFIIGNTLRYGEIVWPHALYSLLDQFSDKEFHFQGGDSMNWRASRLADAEKMEIVSKVKRGSEGASQAFKKSLLMQVCRENQYDFDKLTDEKRYLAKSEISELHAGGNGIGGHGMSHEKIGTLPLSRKEEEIEQSKTLIMDLVNESFVPFAYPIGEKNSFQNEDKDILEKKGFSCALSTIEGLNGKDADLFELKRVEIGNYGVAEFAVRVNGVIGDIKTILKKIIGRN